MKSPRALCAVALLSGTLLSAPAYAQAQASATRDYSPITGSFELKLGGYYPSNIDAELVDRGESPAFQEFYGTSNLLYGELVVERYIFKRFGKLGFGGHVGIARRKGAVQAADGGGEGGSEEETGDIPGETNFRLIPLRASLFYKYDYSAIHHNIPLVPFVRGGLDYYLWRIADGNGDVSEAADGSLARGGRAGWHASVGLQFLLDSIDPATAAAFDLSWGVNNSYLFGEYMVTRINSFGREGLDLSDNQWLFGLAFEF